MEVINCETCKLPIDGTDWSNNNVKQLSTGLAHAQCPNKLVISNCPSTITLDLLRKIFSPYGVIKDLSIYQNHAVIEYTTKESTAFAISAMQGFEMGSNKISIQYLSQLNKNDIKNYFNQQIDSKQEEFSTPDGLQYKYNRDELLLLSAREIASFLVPNSKIYKSVYKDWMKLIIQYKQDVIEYIYYSKANDTKYADIFNYISIPDYLKELLSNKKNKKLQEEEKKISDKIKNEPRLETLPSQNIIIVHGYIRRIGNTLNKGRLNGIIPSVIIKVCMDYYVSFMSFYIYQPRQFLIEFDMNEHNKTNKVMMDQVNIKQMKGMNSSIIISDLTSTDLPKLKYQMEQNVSYYGIFGQTNDSQNKLILYEKHDNRNYYQSFTSHCSRPHDLNYDYIYCGKEYGIISNDKYGLYQLKLTEISADNSYSFKLLNKTATYWQTADIYPPPPTDLGVCYMNGVDKLFAVQQSNQHNFQEGESGGGRRCGIYDFKENKWIGISNVSSSLRGDEVIKGSHVIKCGLVYDYHTRSNVYLLANNGGLSSYDVFKDVWLYLFGTDMEGGEDNNYNPGYGGFNGYGLAVIGNAKKPIIWLDPKNANILYYAQLKEKRLNVYDVIVKNYDKRSNSKKWNRCFMDWKDLQFERADYASTQLFK